MDKKLPDQTLYVFYMILTQSYMKHPAAIFCTKTFGGIVLFSKNTGKPWPFLHREAFAKYTYIHG